MTKLNLLITGIIPASNICEYVFSDLLSLRAGYKSLFLDNSEEGLTLGVGLKHNFSSSFGIYVDYAYQDFGILDNSQHFSLGVSF